MAEHHLIFFFLCFHVNAVKFYLLICETRKKFKEKKILRRKRFEFSETKNYMLKVTVRASHYLLFAYLRFNTMEKRLKRRSNEEREKIQLGTYRLQWRRHHLYVYLYVYMFYCVPIQLKCWLPHFRATIYIECRTKTERKMRLYQRFNRNAIDRKQMQI